MSEKLTEHYEAYLICDNCGAHTLVTIPKGKTIDKYEHHNVCHNCGCQIKQTRE